MSVGAYVFYRKTRAHESCCVLKINANTHVVPPERIHSQRACEKQNLVLSPPNSLLLAGRDTLLCALAMMDFLRVHGNSCNAFCVFATSIKVSAFFWLGYLRRSRFANKRLFDSRDRMCTIIMAREVSTR
jgi:hypothetical protein